MTLKKWMAVLLALVMVFGFAACGDEGGKDEVVAKVGDTELTAEGLETYASITCMMYYNMDYSTIDESYKSYVRQMMLQDVVDMKIAEMYCEDKGIDVKATENYEENLQTFLKNVETGEDLKKIAKNCKLTNAQLKAYYHGICAGNVVYEEVKAGFADIDEKAAAYYEEHKADSYTTTEKESTVSHILVEDEAAAKEVLNKLNAGGDFAELAKEYSSDGSASNGGLLGTYSKSNCGWVDEFKEAAFALKKGEISQPVKSEFGYHIIYVSDCIEAGAVKPFDTVKEDIKEQLLYDAYTEKRSQLQEEYSAEYLLTLENETDEKETGTGTEAR